MRPEHIPSPYSLLATRASRRQLIAMVAVGAAAVAGSGPASAHGQGGDREHGGVPKGGIEESAAREPLIHPFSSTSPWNHPIGSAASYAPAGMGTIKDGQGEWTQMPMAEPERIILTPAAPATVIGYSSAGWTGTSRCAVTGSILATAPIPASYVVPSDPSNGVGAILASDGRTIINLQPFTRCSAGGPATSIVRYADSDLYGDGIVGAHGGSRLSGVGGTLRLGELRPGSDPPSHALKFVMPSTHLYGSSVLSETWRWPAATSDASSDTYSGTIPALKMGALLAIPANVDLSTIGLESDAGEQVAWSLQNYGAYVVDATSAGINLACEEGAAGSFSAQFLADHGYTFDARVHDDTPWVRDMLRILDNLAVVDNNTPTTIGGGGTPLVPLSPELEGQ